MTSFLHKLKGGLFPNRHFFTNQFIPNEVVMPYITSLFVDSTFIFIFSANKHSIFFFLKIHLDSKISPPHKMRMNSKHKLLTLANLKVGFATICFMISQIY